MLIYPFEITSSYMNTRIFYTKFLFPTYMTNISLLEAHLRRAYLFTILKPLRKQKTMVAYGSRPQAISHLVPKVTNSSLVLGAFKL